MEDTSGFEETPTGPAAILEAVKKFGIVKLLLVILVLGAVLWFFVLAPKPGTVRFVVKEIDTGNALDNVEVDLSVPGQNTLTKFTTSSGSVSFDNVPSETDVELSISPPSTHRLGADAPSSVRLKSGESKTIAVTAVQKQDLALKLSEEKLSLGTGCQTTLTATVTNNGPQPATVQLVGDGKLDGLVTSQSVSLAPKETQDVNVTIKAPDSKQTASGTVRVRLTDASADLSVETGDPEDLRVGPSSYSDRVEPGASVKEQFTVQNNGRSGEARDLASSLTGDFSQLGAQTEFADNGPLKPRDSKILTLALTAPSQDGKYVGVMIVSSACQQVQVPLELNVESRR